MNSLPTESWENVTVRNTSKGELKGDYHFKFVYILEEGYESNDMRDDISGF
jgi:hypothetical protein